MPEEGGGPRLAEGEVRPVIAQQHGLPMGTFLAGWAGLAAVGGALGWGAWSMRRGVLPEWTGAPARLAELVLGLAALFATAQLAGTVKLLRPLPLLVGEVAAGLGMVAGGRWLARRVDHASVSEPAPAASAPRWETALAAVGVAAVALQWATHVADALGRGMTHSDTLWYHQPFAIRFVQ